MLIQPTTAKLNTANGLLMTAPGMTALHLRIADFKFTHHIVLCDRLPDTEVILELTFKRSFQFHMLGTWIKIVTYKEKKSSLHIQETVNRRQQQVLLNQPLKYCLDTMVLYQLRSQVKQLRNIWLTLLLMRTCQKAGTLIFTSSMASTASKKNIC